MFILVASWVTASITGQWWTCLILYLVYLLTEFVSLCLEAESRMRDGMDRSRIDSPNTENCKWWTNKAGTQHFYKTDEKLRRSFRIPFRWLPVSWLWRMSLWVYFW